MKNNFKIGDKVIPISKTTGCPLDQSRQYQYKEFKDQGFLYINYIDARHYICSVEASYGLASGDFFKEEDLIPYEKPLETGDSIFVSDESHLKALKDENSRIFLGYTTDGKYICCVANDSMPERNDSAEVYVWNFAARIPKQTAITFDLTDDYQAVISKDSIQVGCQTISYEKFDELTEIVNKLRVL